MGGAHASVSDREAINGAHRPCLAFLQRDMDHGRDGWAQPAQEYTRTGRGRVTQLQSRGRRPVRGDPTLTPKAKGDGLGTLASCDGACIWLLPRYTVACTSTVVVDLHCTVIRPLLP
jgi:hypothetical protein